MSSLSPVTRFIISKFVFSGGYLVAGHQFDRVCSDGSSQPRGVPTEGPAKDTKVGAAQTRQPRPVRIHFKL